MKINYLLVGLLITCFSGCSKMGNAVDPVTTDVVKVYTIKKGSHSADGNSFKLVYTSTLNCEVVFDSSAIYQSRIKGNQQDVNKLIGFSDCGDHHQQNSARLGWSWNGEAVAMYAYAYRNGERVIRYLKSFPLHQSIVCAVSVVGDKYYFSAGSAKDSLNRHCAGYGGVRYKLYPYFGGDETAPHDITIKMKTSD